MTEEFPEEEFETSTYLVNISRPVNSMAVYQAMRDFYAKEMGVSVKDYNHGAMIITYYKPQHDIFATVESGDNKVGKIVLRVRKTDFNNVERHTIATRCDIIRRKLEQILTEEDDTLH